MDSQSSDEFDCAECEEYAREREAEPARVYIAPPGTKLGEPGWKPIGMTVPSGWFESGVLEPAEPVWSEEKLREALNSVPHRFVMGVAEDFDWGIFRGAGPIVATPEPEERAGYTYDNPDWRANAHYKAYVRPVITDALIEGNK